MLRKIGVIFPTACSLSPPGTNRVIITANPAVRFLAFGESKSKGNGLIIGIVRVSITCDSSGLEKLNYGQLSDCLSASEAHSIFLPSSKESESCPSLLALLVSSVFK